MSLKRKMKNKIKIKIKRKTLGTIIMCRTQFLFDSKYMISYILIIKIHKRKQYLNKEEGTN